MLFAVRFFILALSVREAYEDLKEREVRSLFLYIILVFQGSTYYLQTHEWKRTMALFVAWIVTDLVYASLPLLPNWVGIADILYVWGEYAALPMRYFLVFWWVHLMFALGGYYIFWKKDKEKRIPMYPAYAAADFLAVTLWFFSI